MDQSPWSRKVPPRPPSGPNGPAGLRGNIGHDQKPIVPSPPNLPPGTSRPIANSSPHKKPIGKKRNGFKIPHLKRVLTVLSVLIAFLVGGTIVRNVLSNGSNEISSVTESTDAVETAGSTLPPIGSEAGKANWDALARSVVFIEALEPCNWRGSGTLVLDGSYVLTNEHVSSDGRCTLIIGLTDGLSNAPSGDIEAVVVARDPNIDLAVLRLIDRDGNPLIPVGHNPVSIDYGQPALGSKFTTLGYPALGSYEAGMTITFTSGDFAGIDNVDGEFYKTTAQMRGGVSGGAAFNESGLFVGIPTAGLIDEESGDAVGINLIRPVKYAKPLLEQAQSSPLNLNGGTAADSDSGESGYDEAQNDPRFRTCKDAKANGYGPYFIALDPEYDWYIDADSDGKVCE